MWCRSKQINLTWPRYSNISIEQLEKVELKKRKKYFTVRLRKMKTFSWDRFYRCMYVRPWWMIRYGTELLHSSNMHMKASLICAHSSAIVSPAAPATSSPICTMAFMTTARSLENFKVALSLLFSIWETMTLFTHSLRFPSSIEVKGADPPLAHRACWFLWYSWECSINCTRVLRSFFSTACSSIDWSVGSDCSTLASITGRRAHLDSNSNYEGRYKGL